MTLAGVSGTGVDVNGTFSLVDTGANNEWNTNPLEDSYPQYELQVFRSGLTPRWTLVIYPQEGDPGAHYEKTYEYSTDELAASLVLDLQGASPGSGWPLTITVGSVPLQDLVVAYCAATWPSAFTTRRASLLDGYKLYFWSCAFAYHEPVLESIDLVDDLVAAYPSTFSLSMTSLQFVDAFVAHYAEFLVSDPPPAGYNAYSVARSLGLYVNPATPAQAATVSVQPIIAFGLRMLFRYRDAARVFANAMDQVQYRQAIVNVPGIPEDGNDWMGSVFSPGLGTSARVVDIKFQPAMLGDAFTGVDADNLLRLTLVRGFADLQGVVTMATVQFDGTVAPLNNSMNSFGAFNEDGRPLTNQMVSSLGPGDRIMLMIQKGGNVVVPPLIISVLYFNFEL